MLKINAADLNKLQRHSSHIFLAQQNYLITAFNSPLVYLFAMISSLIGLILPACPAQPNASKRALQTSFAAAVATCRNFLGSKLLLFSDK